MPNPALRLGWSITVAISPMVTNQCKTLKAINKSFNSPIDTRKSLIDYRFIDCKPSRPLESTEKHSLPTIKGFRAKFFFDPKELVVLGDSLAASRGARLDLSAA